MPPWYGQNCSGTAEASEPLRVRGRLVSSTLERSQRIGLPLS